MKKLLLSVAVVATMGLASCGGEEAGESEVCKCAKMEKPSDDCKKLAEKDMAKFAKEAEACGKDKKDDKAAH